MAEEDTIRRYDLFQMFIELNNSHIERFSVPILNDPNVYIKSGSSISIDTLQQLLDEINSRSRVSSRFTLPVEVYSGSTITKISLAMALDNYKNDVETGICSSGCDGGCISTCQGSCAFTCYYDCSSGCINGCMGGCADGCAGSCKNGSQIPVCQNCGAGCHTGGSGCSWGCHGCDGCSGRCNGGCKGTCHYGCGNGCSNNCMNGCSYGCSDCAGSCMAACSQNCFESCRGSCSGEVN